MLMVIGVKYHGSFVSNVTAQTQWVYLKGSVKRDFWTEGDDGQLAAAESSCLLLAFQHHLPLWQSMFLGEISNDNGHTNGKKRICSWSTFTCTHRQNLQITIVTVRQISTK